MAIIFQITVINAVVMVLSTYWLKVECGGINLGACDDTRFQCRCGADPKANVRLPIKQCTFFYKWKPSCKPCNKITTYDVCPKYINCLRCHEKDEENGRCTECPPGKYGPWCDGVCACENKATCDREGKCHCSDKYEGTRCEIVKDVYCPYPVPPKNGFADYSSTKEGSTIIYRCNPNHKIVGTATNKCLKAGVWSHPAPICVVTCKVPETMPENMEVRVIDDGEGSEQETSVLIKSESNNIMAAKIRFSCKLDYTLDGYNTLTCTGPNWNGPIPRCIKRCSPLPSLQNGHVSPTENKYDPDSIVTFTCDVGYVLQGNITATCKEDGSWDKGITTCEPLKLCNDPGTPTGGSRQATSPFAAGSSITFNCESDSIMIGKDHIVCSSNGEWSDKIPSCLTVSEKKISCETTGEDVMLAANEPVRIQCPPACGQAPGNVWGTIIYEARSTVCKAAVHSGKLKDNSGGAVIVINNQQYSGFLPSTINGVSTQSINGVADSFRFSNTPPEIFGNGALTTECPKYWTEVGDVCILVVNKKKVWQVAESVCGNIDAELTTKKPNKLSKLAPFLSEEGRSYWMKSHCTFFEDGEIQGPSIAEDKDCTTLRPFMCQLRLLSRGAGCDKPVNVPKSKRKAKNSINGKFFEGSELTYTCDELYYMEGGDTIKCLPSGKWDFPTPLCHRIPACDELKPPANGFLEYTEPVAATQSTASRRGQFPAPRIFPFPKFGGGKFPLSISAKTNETAVKEGLMTRYNIPEGYYRVGVRASVMCKSKLYKRVGSRVRRCLKNGRWSGSQSSCIPVCGVASTSRASFVANGNVSNVGEWPWQVAVSRWWTERNIFFLVCGGSLLNENWILTAAHCVTYQQTSEVVPPTGFQIYLGKHYRNDSSDDHYVQIRFASEIHVHPEYDPVIFDSDIALLKLNRPAELTTRVRPVCLPTFKSANDHLVAGEIGVVTGWGALETDNYPEELQQAKVKVVSSNQCVEDYRSEGLPLTITDYMFCAGYKEGKADACSGDSGGPIVFQDKSTHKWLQEGIVSWGSPNGCGNKNQYGGYTRVERFIEWIQEFL